MKIRHDFVSNSSSCSFILKSANAQRGFEKFIEDFKEFVDSNDWSVPDMNECRILITAKDLFFLSLNEFHQMLASNKLKISDIDEIRFSCEDYDAEAIACLRHLYDYFAALDLEPDADNSERPFLFDDKTSFYGKLVSKSAEYKNMHDRDQT